MYNPGTVGFETKWTPTQNSIKSGIGVIEKMWYISLVLVLFEGCVIFRLGPRIWKPVTV